jgi:iron complex outermembrane receptor protein
MGLGAVSCPVHAQVQPAGGAQTQAEQSSLQDIIVTARKRSESAQSVPISITAVGAEQLKARSVNTISDLQALAPGLYLQQGFDDPQSLALTLRGRKQNDNTLLADPSVGLYVDGLYIPRQFGLAASLVDLSRVEVLRGPAGTLYGRNTTGGAISIFTTDPTDELSGSVDLTFGNHATASGVGILNVPINDDVAARFVVQRGISDGYGHDGVGRKFLSQDSQYYRTKLRARIGDSWKILVAGHYEKSDSGGGATKIVGLTPAGFGDPSDPEGGFLTLVTQGALGLTEDEAVSYLRNAVAQSQHDFYSNHAVNKGLSQIKRADANIAISGDITPGVEFRSITGYQWLKYYASLPSLLPVPSVSTVGIKRDQYYSQEFQILGGEQSRFNWIVGFYGGFEKGRDYTGIDFLGVSQTSNDNRAQNRSLAGFAQATWEFLPDWHVTGGGRYSIDRRRNDATDLDGGACVIPAPGVDSTNTGPAQCPRRFQTTFKKPSWLISFDHKLNDDVLAYAKAAQGYRSGGQQASGSVLADSFIPFKPETNVEFEAGIKSYLFDRKLRLNLDAYRDKYSDLQVTTQFQTATGDYGSRATNAASAVIWGVEAESDLVVSSGLTLHGSTAYTHAKYKKFFDVSGDRSAEPFPVPKWTWAIGARYVHTASFGTASINLDYNWQSKVVLDPTAILRSQVTQTGYGLLSGRINVHLNDAGLDVALFGKNLTAKKYYDQAFALEFGGFSLGYPGGARSFGIEIIKKFGAVRE